MITTENQPEQDFKDILDTYWKVTIDFPKPTIIVVNSIDDEVISRVNLDEGDHILISMNSAEAFRPRGNIHYYDRVISGLVATALTKVSRQRVRNMSKMVRAIMFDRKHNFPHYQLVVPVSYREMINTDLNIWRAELVFQVEAHAIAIETLL